MIRVAIPDLISNSYFPLVAAVELGVLKAEGVEAELELIYPVTRTMEALRDRRIDFLAGAAHTTLSAFPRWQGAKLLAAVAQHMYWFLVLRADLAAKRGDVHAVKGLTIGAAPGPDQGLVELLRECGIDPQRDGVRIGPITAMGQGSTVSFGVNAAKALEAGEIDGFWANGMGAEVAVRRGVGTVVLDVRRGDGPPAARSYTFPALVTRDDMIDRQPDVVAGVVRALVAVQRTLRSEPRRATEVGTRLFPEEEAGLIAILIERDAPYYDAAISPAAVASLGRFAQRVGLADHVDPYDHVVATEFVSSW